MGPGAQGTGGVVKILMPPRSSGRWSWPRPSGIARRPEARSRRTCSTLRRRDRASVAARSQTPRHTRHTTALSSCIVLVSAPIASLSCGCEFLSPPRRCRCLRAVWSRATGGSVARAVCRDRPPSPRDPPAPPRDHRARSLPPASPRAPLAPAPLRRFPTAPRAISAARSRETAYRASGAGSWPLSDGSGDASSPGCQPARERPATRSATPWCRLRRHHGVAERVTGQLAAAWLASMGDCSRRRIRHDRRRASRASCSRA